MKFLRKSKQVFFFFFFVDFEKLTGKLTCKGTGAKIAKTILKRENKVVNITLPDEKPYCITTVMKICHESMDQNRELRNITDPNKYVHLVFDRDAKTPQ